MKRTAVTLLASICLCSVALAAPTTQGVIEAKADESLTALRDRARGSRSSTTQPIKIVLAGGMRTLAEPLVLTADDSNTTWEAEAGQTPVLSGGRRIDGWHVGSFNGQTCWVAEAAWLKDQKPLVHELWIDGKRAVRARWPNRGHYLHIKESPDAGANWEIGQTRFRFDGADVPAGPFSDGAEAIVASRWVESRLPIKSVDVAQHLVSFARKSQFRMEAKDAYWLEGDARWLDEPGEFYIDRSAGMVYYIPLPGQSIDKIEAVAPAISQLVILRGDPAGKKLIENVTFRGITFAHTEWMLPDADLSVATSQPISGGFAQASLNVPASVSGQGLRGVTFEQCTFQNMGTWGLELGPASQNCRVSRCTFRDLGAGGIKLGDGGIVQGAEKQTFGNEIADCEISDCGWVFPSAVGVWLGQAFDNRITHNEIHDLFYSGISAGWSWGYGDSLNRGNIIEKNHVHHIGTRADGDGGILADMGAIYLLGGRQGTVVRNNVLHDIYGVRIAWGVYLDEGCSDVIVENNLVHHTGQGALHLHYGKDNIIRNNIFTLGKELQIWRTREEEHNSFTLEHNLIEWTGGPMTRTGPKNVKFDHNVYSGIAETDFRAGDLTWEKWRGAGEDANSFVVKDSIFADAEKGDFTVKAREVVEKVGFKEFDYSDVGVRKR